MADAIKEAVKDIKFYLDRIEELTIRNKKLEVALRFYKDGFKYHPKRTITGINLSEWKPTEELLNDCGETAIAALGEKKDG
jgi:hypothetical protein